MDNLSRGWVVHGYFFLTVLETQNFRCWTGPQDGDVPRSWNVSGYSLPDDTQGDMVHCQSHSGGVGPADGARKARKTRDLSATRQMKAGHYSLSETLIAEDAWIVQEKNHCTDGLFRQYLPFSDRPGGARAADPGTGAEKQDQGGFSGYSRTANRNPTGPAGHSGGGRVRDLDQTVSEPDAGL